MRISQPVPLEVPQATFLDTLRAATISSARRPFPARRPSLTKRIQAEALTRKLIVLTAGTYVNVIRIISPLVTTPEEVGMALSVLDDSLRAAGV